MGLPVPRRLLLLTPFVVLFAVLLLATGCGGGDGASSTTESQDGDASSGDATSASGNATRASGLGEFRYLAIGDSLSQGVGADDIETGSFPARLVKRWGDAGCAVDLLNAGISGYTAAQMITDQVPNIADFKPTLITFQSGANDIANGVTKDQYRKDVGTVMDAAVKSGARVYVLLQNEWFRAPDGPGYGGTREIRDAYDSIMLEVAKTKKVDVLDLRPLYKQQADRNEWIDDGIHPTAKAYDAWAERLVSLIPQPCKK